MVKKRKTITPPLFEKQSDTELRKFLLATLLERTDRLWRLLRNGRKLTNTAVHDIRVAIRRAEAALTLSRPFLPKRPAKRLRKRLRKLRRKLGVIRNLDVFAERCLRWTEMVPREHWASLILAIASERDCAVRSMRRDLKAMPWKSMRRRTKQCLRKLRRTSTIVRKTWQELIGRAIKKPLAVLQKTKCDDLVDFAKLHAVRLACKRLRYLCELAAEQSPENATQELVQRLRAAQRRLGNVNDAVNAVRQQEEVQALAVGADVADTLRQIASLEQTNLVDTLADLLAWWQTENLANAVTTWQENVVQHSPTGS